MRTFFKHEQPKRRKRSTVRTADWRKVCRLVDERDGGRCRVCGRSDRPLGRHHIVFRSKQGPNTTGNVVTLCLVCHDCVHCRQEPWIDITGDADGELTVSPHLR